jgi:hypothetical protein
MPDHARTFHDLESGAGLQRLVGDGRRVEETDDRTHGMARGGDAFMGQELNAEQFVARRHPNMRPIPDHLRRLRPPTPIRCEKGQFDFQVSVSHCDPGSVTKRQTSDAASGRQAAFAWVNACIHGGRRTSRLAPLPGNPRRFSIHRSIHRMPCPIEPHRAMCRTCCHWITDWQHPARASR